MNRNDIDTAINYIKQIEYLEKIQKYFKDNERYEMYGSSYTIHFGENLTYSFPANLEYSMFHNVLKSSVDNDLQRLNKLLQEI
jgi:hypothetical protein